MVPDVPRERASERARDPRFRGLASRALRFGLPLALGMAFQGLFNCVDLLVVARLGAGAIAAVTVAGIVNMVAMLLYNGVATATGARVAQAVGADDRLEIERTRQTDARLLVLFSILLGLGFYLPAGPLVALFGADSSTYDGARRYLEIMSIGSPTMFYMMSAGAVLRGLGNASWPVAALVVANVLNVVFCVILVFGELGFPAMGVAGSAWATTLARVVGCAILAVGLHRVGGKSPVWRAPRGAAFARRCWTQAREGLGMSLQMVVRVAGMYFLLAIAVAPGGRRLGAAQARDLLDGVGLCIRLETIVAFFALGYGTAAGALVGQSVGAGEPDRARRAVFLCAGYAAVCATLIGGGLWFFRSTLMPLADPAQSAAAAGEATLYLLYTVPLYGAMAANIVLAQGLQGSGSIKVPLAIDAAAYLGVAVGGGFFLAARLGEAHGAWIGLAAAHAAAALAYVLAWRSRWWRRLDFV
jgi:putative MATE family efflux protein